MNEELTLSPLNVYNKYTHNIDDASDYCIVYHFYLYMMQTIYYLNQMCAELK